MIFRREHPNTPSKRLQTTLLNPLGSKIKKKFFYVRYQDLVGKHFGKKTCLRRKKTTYTTKFNLLRRVHTSKPGVVIQISLARRHKTFVSLVKYSNGAISCLPAFNGASLKYVLKTLEYLNNPKFFFSSSIKTGYTLAIGFLNVTACFFNISFTRHAQAFFCRSGGTFCILMRYNLDKGLCVSKLPSGKLIFINEQAYVMLGRNSNIFLNGIRLGKAGINVLKGFRPAVRGVAKNPVDHPHGGRTKSNSPERTPWGQVAKHNK